MGSRPTRVDMRSDIQNMPLHTEEEPRLAHTEALLVGVREGTCLFASLSDNHVWQLYPRMTTLQIRAWATTHTLFLGCPPGMNGGQDLAAVGEPAEV